MPQQRCGRIADKFDIQPSKIGQRFEIFVSQESHLPNANPRIASITVCFDGLVV